jgi:hypothetical protein
MNSHSANYWNSTAMGGAHSPGHATATAPGGAGTLRRFNSTAGGAKKAAKGPPENVPSLLLSPEENLAVFQALGQGRQVRTARISEQ